MIDFSVNRENYRNDLMELIRSFEQRTDESFALGVECALTDGEFAVRLNSDKLPGFVKHCRFALAASDPAEVKRLEKRYLKIAIYGTLAFLTGITLPYGCLTGIRPTKLYSELGEEAREMFERDFSVAPEKVELIRKTVEVQRPVRNTNERAVDVFVFIPFCPTRCAYCSFVSMPVDKQKKLPEPYVECLLKELEIAKEAVRCNNFEVRSVYVGGGTPTALPLALLDKILVSLSDFNAAEFTVEAGRPDTVDKRTVALLKKRGVTRMSVNPQTFNDRTLALIGRGHTTEDTIAAYKCVRKKFDVNMDLIAMLPEESLDDFKRSVDAAVKLSPADITVHTLYMKRGSELKKAGYSSTDYATAAAMVDYACRALTAAGYRPYYMYRQKYTSGNLENVGYAKPGKECIYNVDIMEEDTSIIACGAAAISKKVTVSRNLIERNANYKEPLEYVRNFDTVVKRARAFWLPGSDTLLSGREEDGGAEPDDGGKSATEN